MIDADIPLSYEQIFRMKEDVSQLKTETKVLGYIVKKVDKEIHILIFAHRDFPSAGLQVPGGSIEEGEELKTGILREVKEESGLSEFSSIINLGKSIYIAESKQELHERHFFQLNFKGEIKGDFFHKVTIGKEDKGLIFHYQWVPLVEIPKLAADQGCLVNQIIVSEIN